MPHAMNPQPGFLQQVISLFPARHLAPEESQQGRAECNNQSSWRLRIGSLVTLHPTIQVYKGLPRRNVLLEAGLHLLGIRNRTAWSYAIGQHLS
jgi:hypothetical protein